MRFGTYEAFLLVEVCADEVLFFLQLKMQMHLRPCFTELQGVAQEVNNHLQESVLVAVNVLVNFRLSCRHLGRFQRNPFYVCVMFNDFKSLFNHFKHAEISLVQFESVLFHLGQI